MASTPDQPLSPHSEADDAKDCLISKMVNTKKELQAVENALLRILQEENPLPASEHEMRKAELSRRLSDAAHPEHSDSPSKNDENGLESNDLMLLSKLLNQVRQLNMEQKRDDLSSGESSPVVVRGSQKPHRYSKRALVEEESALSRSEKMFENVLGVANAAAEAAKAAAATASKNVEIMESLLGTSKNLNVHRGKHSEKHQSEMSQDECSDESGIDEQTKEFVKRVEKQNRITHWMIGIMMVMTLAWRLKITSMAVDFKNSITNPFQSFGDMFDGIGGSKKDENKPFERARAMLQDKGKKKEKQKFEKVTSDDPNVAEGLAHSLDKMLNGGMPFSDGNNGSEQSEE